MTITARTLATLAIAASTVPSALQGATDAAYACHRIGGFAGGQDGAPSHVTLRAGTPDEVVVDDVAFDVPMRDGDIIRFERGALQQPRPAAHHAVSQEVQIEIKTSAELTTTMSALRRSIPLRQRAHRRPHRSTPVAC